MGFDVHRIALMPEGASHRESSVKGQDRSLQEGVLMAGHAVDLIWQSSDPSGSGKDSRLGDRTSLGGLPKWLPIVEGSAVSSLAGVHRAVISFVHRARNLPESATTSSANGAGYKTHATYTAAKWSASRDLSLVPCLSEASLPGRWRCLAGIVIKSQNDTTVLAGRAGQCCFQ